MTRTLYSGGKLRGIVQPEYAWEAFGDTTDV